MSLIKLGANLSWFTGGCLNVGNCHNCDSMQGHSYVLLYGTVDKYSI